MADIFKGLAGGFGLGMQLGQAVRERRQREALAEAYGLTPQEQLAREATPEELQRAQAEAQALQQRDVADFGLTPQEAQQYAPAMPTQGARVSMPTYTLGGQTFSRAPTQEQLDDARMRAAADVYGQFGDAARREELMRGLRQEQRSRAQEARSAAGFETQQELAGLQISQRKREVAAGDRMDAFATWAQQNPDQARDFNAVRAKATELRMTPDEIFKTASNITGIKEQEFKASQQRIQELVKGQGLDGLLKAHKESNDLDPGSHFEATRGKDGRVTLNRVDTATGAIIQPNVFSGKEAEVVGYLNKAAMDPTTIVDYTMNLEKARAQIEASQASAAKDRAYTGLLNTRGDETKGMQKKIDDFKKAFGRDPTETEKQIMFGLVPKPREVSNADVISLSKELAGKPTGRMVDGKPERYTEATAVSAARAILEQQPGPNVGMPSWGEAPRAPAAPGAAPAAAAPASTPARPATDPLAFQLDRETEELSLGMRTAYSPEVQAVLDAQAARRRSGEQDYLQRERALATGRGLWR